MPDPAPPPTTQRAKEGDAPSRPPLIPRSGTFIALVVGLLIVNLVISFMTGGPSDRERVPYQPFFVDQLTAGNVDEITSQADSIEGELERGGDLRPARG